MTDTSLATENSKTTWRSTQAYALAIAALGLGIGMGYVGRGNLRNVTSTRTGKAAVTQPPSANVMGQQSIPSLDQIKQMADKKAAPLLERLKTQPDNAAVLAEVAHTYFAAHQFEEALPYYERSLKADPKNVGIRADFASCLFYSGEVDKSLATLEEALRHDPRNAQVLFNLGMIRWKAKGDSAGAIATWQRLLKANPGLPKSNREQVENAIARAKQGVLP